LDFPQQSAQILPCHNQTLDNFGAEVHPHPALHPNYERTINELPNSHSPSSSSLLFAGDDNTIKTSAAEKMQEFLLQKFSNQDFDLLTKNYDFFLQYYKQNCPPDQLMDEKHLSMDFLTQFYHLSEFKKKLNGSEFNDEISDDDGNNDNDDVVALDDMMKDEASDLSKGKMGINSMHNNKRLRTTILPEQLNYLYECYQKESNPSRKQLEEIAKKVNLKKRVVQVKINYFQNSKKS
jgi:hypothetical protein